MITASVTFVTIYLFMGVFGGPEAASFLPPGMTVVSFGLLSARLTWIGDAVGTVLIAPTLLVWAGVVARASRPSPARLLEAVILGAFLLASALVSFGAVAIGPIEHEYFIFPALFWAALRFGPGGATLLSLVSELVLAWLTLHGMGPFADTAAAVIDPARMQTFVIVSAASVFLLATSASERQQASEEAGRLRAETRFSKLIEQISDMVMVVDQQGRLNYFNAAVGRVLGYSRAQLAQLAGEMLVHPDDLYRVKERIRASADDSAAFGAMTFRVRRETGHWVPVEAVATDRSHDPEIAGWVFTVRDITERRQAEAQLREMAFHDALTGLPNRALLGDRLLHALQRAREHGELTGVVFLDLDNFKWINDSLGHEAGDQLLRTVADRLRMCVGPADTVARLGGDEFTILLEDLDTPARAEQVAERVATALHAPVSVAGREVTVSASLGIALGGADDQPGELLRKADLAMYAAKSRGKARYAAFAPAMEQSALARMELEADLRRALASDEFVVHYQPLVDLESAEVREVEALVRWQHPLHGLVAPDRFVPLAEETGLIVPIGRRVLELACAQVRAWRQAGRFGPELTLSVNLAAPQLEDPGFVDDVCAILRSNGMQPQQLQLEITERIALDHSARTATALTRLAELGIRIALDDFGAGNSALGYLQHFPISTLKIDRSFVAGLGTQPRASAVVQGVVALARALNLGVTGEGIETAEQLAQLRAIGCHQAQGFYLGRPAPADQFNSRPEALPRAA